MLARDDEELSAFRGQTASMIFQEPALTLDPGQERIARCILAEPVESLPRPNGRPSQTLQPPRPGSAQRSIWEAPTICLG